MRSLLAILLFLLGSYPFVPSIVAQAPTAETGKGTDKKSTKKKNDHPINPLDTGGPRLRGGNELIDPCSSSVSDIEKLVAVFDQLAYAPYADKVQVSTQQDLMNGLALLQSFERGRRAIQGYEPVQTRGGQGIEIYKRVAPAVVLVVVGKETKGDIQIQGLGSGAIVDSRGYVLTNWHVVAGHPVVAIFLKPQGSANVVKELAYGATVVAMNPTSDLALLRMQDAPSTLPTLQFEEPSRIEVAENIHIVGHPKGKLWSYTTGVVSQIRDSYTWTYSDRSRHKAKVLQLQTAVNPGNSGGPVVDDESKLIGLVAASTDAQNLNYAIAGDAVQQFFKSNMIQVRGSSDAQMLENMVQGSFSTWKNYVIVRDANASIKTFTVLDTARNTVVQISKFKDGTILQRCTTPDGKILWRSWVNSNAVEAIGDVRMPSIFAANSTSDVFQ